MRVSCMKDKLYDGIRIVSRAVPKRSPYPVLSNIFFGTDTSGKSLKLSATDREIGITAWIEATSQEAGATTLPAKLFADLVKQSPPERITLELEPVSQKLKYQCGPVNATIKGINAEEFPIILTESADDCIRIQGELLKEMIEQVAFAAATDESRPALTGVLMDFNEDRLTMGAADGFRLSVRTASLEELVPYNIQVIVPANGLNEVAKVISNPEEIVEITITDNKSQILFRLSDVALFCQLIEGSFPDVERLVPTEYETRTVIDTAPFLKAVRRADIFARDAAHIIRLTINNHESEEPNSTLTLSAEATELGQNIEDLMVNVEGQSMEIAFNAKYLLELLKVINSSQIVLETLNSGSPGVIKPIGNPDFRHVIMPMHLNAR